MDIVQEQKKWLAIKLIVLALLVVAASTYLTFNSGEFPPELPLNTSSGLQNLAQAFAALLAWLFAVALFVERAVEVIVMVFRDEQADLLEQTEDRINRKLKTAIDNCTILDKKDPAPSQAEKDGAQSSVASLRQQLAGAETDTTRYRNNTKKIALIISFVTGVCVSFAGIHALSNVLAPPKDVGAVSKLFKVLDIIITGAMIAGGSEGIHRMANAFTSTMDALSAKADQTQKNLNTNP